MDTKTLGTPATVELKCGPKGTAEDLRISLIVEEREAGSYPPVMGYRVVVETTIRWDHPRPPQVVMHEGQPYLHEPRAVGEVLVYSAAVGVELLG